MKVKLRSFDGREILIDVENGKIKADFQGFRGAACERMAEGIEKLLSAKLSLEKREKKEEYYAEEAETVSTGG